MLATDAATNGATGDDGDDAGAAPDSAVAVEPSHPRHTANATGVAMPDEGCAAVPRGLGGSTWLSLDGESPKVMTHSQRSEDLPANTQMSAHEGAVKTEPAAATAGAVPAAEPADPATAPAAPRQLLNVAAQSSDSNTQHADKQLPTPQGGSAILSKGSKGPVDSGAAAADTAAAIPLPSVTLCPKPLAPGSDLAEGPSEETLRLPGVHATASQPRSASGQIGVKDTPDAILPQVAEDLAAFMKQVEMQGETLLSDAIAALPRVRQADVQRVAERSGSVQSEPTGLSAEQLEKMRQLVAQLGGPSAAQHSTAQPHPQQAAPASSVDQLLAPAPIPVQQPGGPIQRPALPINPRPARSCSLTQASILPRPEHEHAAAARMAQPGRPSRSDVRPQHFFAATRPLPGLAKAPDPKTASAPPMGPHRMPFQNRQPTPQQDGNSPPGLAAAALPGVMAAGVSHQHAAVLGLEAEQDTDARIETKTGSTTPQAWRTPTHVRLPSAGHRVVAPRPKGDGGSSGPLPPADGAPWVPASVPAAAAWKRSVSAHAMPINHQQGAPASSRSVPLAQPTESRPASVRATAAGLTPAAEPAQTPHALVDPAAAALEAWLHGLPPAVHKELAAVKQLVLPRKKLQLLADLDAHLYNASKSALCQNCDNLDTSQPETAASVPVCNRHHAQHTNSLPSLSVTGIMHSTPTACCMWHA